MSVDEVLLNNFKEGNKPILRLYGWEPSVSFGRFSKPNKSLDLKYLEKENISYVRRMTGGGILIHGGDLSYSLILPRELLKNKSVKNSYKYLCRFLIALYKKLGYDADFAHNLEMDEKRTDICLAGNEAYDIIIQGDKIGGNAQRYTKQTLFQHGSIPIKIDKERFEPLFLGDSGLKTAATLNQLGKDITYTHLSKLLKETFCEVFELNAIEDTLTKIEEDEIKKLLEKKYTKKLWNFDGKN